jgi:serine/threonine protein kinase
VRTAPTAPPADKYKYRKQAGTEPLPGYRLLAPLGHGGFGEVWECEAPGGLHKAIKFVFDDRHDLATVSDNNSLRQEASAVESVKAIRHPFLLTLERVERTGPELIIVTELADRNLQDRFEECRAEGQAGIPRDELLAYFADAAEALDLLSSRHGLQHLDVKPANLFLVGSHVKVGDYGLVRSHAGGKGSLAKGLTPRYVAPEVINGNVDPRSDQYSLALVYQELLTGTFPFNGVSGQQILIQHATAEPDLAGLAPLDRPAIRRALSKDPEDRFPSCLALVEALLDPTGVMSATETWREGAGSSLMMRFARMSRSSAEFSLSGSGAVPNPPLRSGSLPTPPARPGYQGRSGRLVNTPRPVTTPGPREEALVPLSRPEFNHGPLVKLPRIFGVERIEILGGSRVEGTQRPVAAEVVEVVVRTAAGGAGQLPKPGELTAGPDGGWMCRFPVRPSGGVIPLKLDAVREEWQTSIQWPDDRTAVLRRSPGRPGGLMGKLSGGVKTGFLEVRVLLPPMNAAVGDVTVTGRVVGHVDGEFGRTAARNLPKMVEDIRKQIQNQPERRASVRVPWDVPMQVYPVSGVGEVHPAVAAKCRDISAGGVCFETASVLPTAYVYAAFAGVGAASGWAILTKLTRAGLEGNVQVVGGKFRTDI